MPRYVPLLRDFALRDTFDARQFVLHEAASPPCARSHVPGEPPNKHRENTHFKVLYSVSLHMHFTSVTQRL